MNIFKQYKLYKKSRKILEVKFIDSKPETNKYAIIIPYRNDEDNVRKKQLEEFINFAKKNFNNTKILIIEQNNKEQKFNRGKLLNVGIKLAKNIEHYIFHDVDLLPDNNLLKYYSTYPNIPIHIARVWKDKYTAYAFFGGITSISKKQVLNINGFPNNFWGWGGEDDALYNRMATIVKNIYAPNKGSVIEMKHKQAEETDKDKINKKQLILNDIKNWKNNGLNNLEFKITNKIKIGDNIKIYSVNI
tara:strand:+ start:15925 stop:16662 length:738 start_codon:yes stop_codon:yes gene_type:complete